MDRLNFVLTHFKEGRFDARRAYRRFRAMASDHANAWPRWWRPAVLSLSFAAIAALLFFRWQGAVTEYKAIDIVQSFTLKDGSRVTLAPGSTLALRAHRNPRAVSMSGKVYFEVAHDEAHPFTVDVPGARVQVLGTRFQVLQDSLGSRVDVTSGRVRLSCGNSSEILTAGQSASASADTVVRVPSTPNPSAWATKTFVYEAEPLGEVLKELSAYFGEKLVTASPGRLLTAKFGAEESLDEIIGLIESALGVSITRESGGTK